MAEGFPDLRVYDSIIDGYLGRRSRPMALAHICAATAPTGTPGGPA